MYEVSVMGRWIEEEVSPAVREKDGGWGSRGGKREKGRERPRKTGSKEIIEQGMEGLVEYLFITED